MTKQRTAALYARFSSDLQKDCSIEDQYAVCEALAKREGFDVTHRFSDRAKSGATMFGRSGIEALIVAAKARKFDVVICENFERLSRDSEDIQYLFKRLNHAEIVLHSVSDGKADSMNVTLRGLMGAMQLKTIAAQVKRGHNGRVRAGKFPGAVTYGYDRIPGQPGERVINLEQAKIIRRIFTEYAAGKSPRDIAIGLTRDNIPSPKGSANWNHQTFVGGGEKNGLIGNRLYIGEIVWNKNHTVTDPDTGRDSIRKTDLSERIVTPVPHLRIIDQKLWDAAQAVRLGRSAVKFGPGGMKIRDVVPRNQHLLSGLLRCGVCNGHMIITNKARGTQFVACAAATSKSACSHRKSYDIAKLKKLVLDNFRENLIDPKRHAEAMRAAHAEYAAEEKRNSAEKVSAEKQVARLTVQIRRLVDAIENSDNPVKELLTSLEAKEAERVGLVERVRLLDASNVVTLHPHVVDAYRENIEQLHEALSCEDIDIDTKLAFHNVMDSIVVQPTGYREDYVVDAYGRLSAIMGINLFPTMRSNKEIVAAEGLSCPDSGNREFSGLALSQQRNGLILLGRWRAAA